MTKTLILLAGVAAIIVASAAGLMAGYMLGASQATATERSADITVMTCSDLDAGKALPPHTFGGACIDSSGNLVPTR